MTSSQSMPEDPWPMPPTPRRRRALPSWGALALAASHLPAVPAANGGFVRAEGVRSELAHLCALRVWEGVERIQTLLYFADRPLDCAAAREALEPETALDRQVEQAGGAAARLRLQPDDANFSLFFTRVAPHASFFVSGMSDELVVEHHSATRVEGSWRTGPREIAAEPVELALRFATTLSPAPLAGEALPAGGGAPAAAYRVYLAAVSTKDFGTLQRLTTGRAAERALGGGFNYFQQGEPKTVEILGGETLGERATLRVRAVTHAGDRVSFRVRMVRDEDGSWRLAERGATTVSAE